MNKSIKLKSIRKLFFFVCIMQVCVFTVLAQPGIRITGIVYDNFEEPTPGVSVVIRGSTVGTTTSGNGEFTITVPSDTSVLQFRFIGYQTQEVVVGNRTVLAVFMKEEAAELGEVVVVAFGTQKKESVIASIETVRVDDLRVPSSNLTTSFAGRMAGLISYQTTGEPGRDNAEFFIRGVASFGTGKVDPLILVDNVEMTVSDLSRLHPDDIASFSIVKDATGTALYGARAANGVILVTTKEGREGKAKVSLRFENTFSMPTTKLDVADPITYMRMANEAQRTRNSLAPDLYSQEKIDNTIRETNAMVYPTTDWMDMLFKNYTTNQRLNLNISGGGKIAQYYIAGSFTQDNGIMKVDKRNNFNNNIDLKKYLLRSNITINLTNTTKAKVRMHGTFEDYTGPIPYGSELYAYTLNVSPVRFPAYYEPDALFAREEHILFGNDNGEYMNPYAEMVKGFRQSNSSVMLAQIELEQDLSKLVKGLNFRALAVTTRTAAFNVRRQYTPFYYDIGSYNRLTDVYTLRQTNQGTDYLRYINDAEERSIASSTYGEAAISYNQTFEKHGVSGMLVGIASNMLQQNRYVNSLSASLPQRNLGLSGRFTYSFDNRYFGEFNFGYNGSEKFDAGNRWGFFPSIGAGWLISNEQFWEGMLDVVNTLKIKGTYGLVGNDAIGSARFFYLSEVTPGGGSSYSTGYDFGKSRQGYSVATYANPNITWELAYKTNVGLEMGLFKKVDIIVDLFQERRTRILQVREDITDELGLWSVPSSNIGEAKSKGVDFSLDYRHSFNSSFWMVGRGTFTYARGTYSVFEEPDYTQYPWRSKIGQPITQRWGYVAERLFIDEGDIEHSARQEVYSGPYGPGDIKYRDISGDGIINELDMVPLGYPIVPEVNYGFGLSMGYKEWDFSFFFQGSARSSFWISSFLMSPFIRNGGLENGLAQFIADDYWSEETQNPYAFWPRLSTTHVPNNTHVLNSKFLQDGAFLRLKSAEIGYSLPRNFTDKVRIDMCRFYVSGNNLLLFSKFKHWDIEQRMDYDRAFGSGLVYPLQRVINVGINVTF